MDDSRTFLVHMDKAKPFHDTIILPLRGEVVNSDRNKKFADRNIEESDEELNDFLDNFGDSEIEDHENDLSNSINMLEPMNKPEIENTLELFKILAKFYVIWKNRSIEALDGSKHNIVLNLCPASSVFLSGIKIYKRTPLDINLFRIY